MSAGTSGGAAASLDESRDRAIPVFEDASGAASAVLDTARLSDAAGPGESVAGAGSEREKTAPVHDDAVGNVTSSMHEASRAESFFMSAPINSCVRRGCRPRRGMGSLSLCMSKSCRYHA